VLLENKVAVITGIGPGLGRELAVQFAREGAAVVIGARTESYLEEVRKEIDDDGYRVLAVPTDIANREHCERIIAAAVDAFGGVDIQCNIAGIPSVQKELLEITGDQVDGEMNRTFKAVLYGCQAAAPIMIAAGRGAIVNISSTAIDRPAPNFGLYHLGKVAVAGLTRTLAMELGPRGVRVNAILPAQVVNPSLEKRMAADPTLESRWLKGIPRGRLGRPSDIQGLAVLLASDASEWITGALIPMDGGNLSLNAGGTIGS